MEYPAYARKTCPQIWLLLQYLQTNSVCLSAYGWNIFRASHRLRRTFCSISFSLILAIGQNNFS